MIEVPMLETLASFWLTEHLFGATWTPERGAMGYDRIINKFRHPFPTKDGYICALPYTDAHWLTFFELAGRPDLCKEQRFVDRTERAQAFQRALPGARLAAEASHRPRSGWRRSTRPTFPAMPVRTLEELSGRSASQGDRLLHRARASDRRPDHDLCQPARFREDQGRVPPPRAAHRRGRRRGAARGGPERRGDRQAEGRQGADRAVDGHTSAIAAAPGRCLPGAARQSRAAADRRPRDHSADRRGDRRARAQCLADRRLLCRRLSRLPTGAAPVRPARSRGRARRRRARPVLAAQSREQRAHGRTFWAPSERAARAARVAPEHPLGQCGRPCSASIRRAG